MSALHLSSVATYLLEVHGLLLAGWLLARRMRSRPALAHSLLCGATLASSVLFVAASGVSAFGWGLGAPSADQDERFERDSFRDTGAASASAGPVEDVSASMNAASSTLVASRSVLEEASSTTDAHSTQLSLEGADGGFPVEFFLGVLAAVLAASSLVSLARSGLAGRSLALCAVPLEDEELERTLRREARALGLRRAPTLHEATVASPMVWCFSGTPRILLPPHRDPTLPWAAVLRHECAHLRRRDHEWSLCFALLSALLPWHPLLRALQRLQQELADAACDDLAVPDARERVEYASALLRFVPVRSMPALLSLRSLGRIGRRLRHLLEDPPAPSPSPRTRVCAGFVALLSVTVLAFAQPGPRTAAEDRITGRVVDPKGRPVAHASLAIVSHSAFVLAKPEPTVARTQADEQGHFSFRWPEESVGLPTNLVLLAWGAQRAIELVPLSTSPPRSALEVVLDEAVDFEVAVVDRNGEPVAGAECSLRSLSRPADDERGYRWISRLPPDLAGLCEAGHTDAQGRAKLPRLAPGTVAGLCVAHPAHAPKIESLSLAAAAGSATVVLDPARRLSVTVVGSDGAAVEGADVTVSSMGALGQVGGVCDGLTDSQGEVELAVFPGSSLQLRVLAPPGQPERPAQQLLSWTDTTVERRVEVTLERSVRLRGRIVEEQSGEPVRARLSWYPRISGNEDYRDGDLMPNDRAATDADGRFEIPVAPGGGHLVVEAGLDHVPVPVVPSEMDPLLSGLQTFAHGCFAISTSRSEPTLEVGDLAVRTGVRLRGRIVDSQGREVERASVASASYVPPGQGIASSVLEVRGGEFVLRGLDPREEHVLWVLAKECGEGATVQIPVGHDDDAPLEIALSPCGSATLAVVDPRGSPLAGRSLRDCSLDLVLVLEEGVDSDVFQRGAMARYAFQSSLSGVRSVDLSTDADGKVTFPFLVPGAPYRILEQFHRVQDFDVAAGEVRDLGVLRTKED